jgi:CRP/FNR family transcriptional regulator
MLTSAAPAGSQSLSGYSFPAGIIMDKTAPARRNVTAVAEEREFEARRQLCTRSSRGPLQRVAALLVAISRNNECEGRDPSAIADTLTCGFVADLLGLSVASLAHVLVELKDRRLIVGAPSSGVRVMDPAGLDRLADTV